MRHKLGIVLREDEEVYAVVRAAGAAYVPRIVFGVLWVLTPFLLFFPLLRMNGMGWVVFGVLALGGVLYLLNLRAQWYGSAIVLTTQHVIDVTRQGLGPAIVTTVRRADVEGLHVTPAPWWGRLLGLSCVRVALRDGAFDMELRGVRNGGAVRELWDEVQCRV